MPTATATMESVNLSLTHTPPDFILATIAKAEAARHGIMPDLEQKTVDRRAVNPTNEAITFWALQEGKGHPKKPHHVRPER